MKHEKDQAFRAMVLSQKFDPFAFFDGPRDLIDHLIGDGSLINADRMSSS